MFDIVRRRSETPTAKNLEEKFKQEVADATLLLDYAVARGVTGPNDRKIDIDLINAIKHAQDLAKDELPSAEERANFDAAYRDLALFTNPVTAETLKATSDDYGTISPIFAPIWPRPVGIIWSRKLSAWTLAVVGLALLGQWFETVYGPLPQGQQAANSLPSFGNALQVLLNLLVPFTYGAIGACVFLLKASHTYIHLRQFDPLRISEYYNRMILGAVAGGMIILLVQQIQGEKETIRFSAAALGFLAGYNNELLFAAIERISAAILPKIGLDSIMQQKPKAASVPIEDVSLKDLLDRLDNAANDDEKKLYVGLIQKIQQRL
jgi:hypothetical protein